MIFALSAAVRFHAKPATEVAARSIPRLAPKARVLAAELKRLEAREIKKQLHVNAALAKEYEKNIGNFEKHRPVPASCLYDAPLYNSLDCGSMDRHDAEWANRYVRIFSGLYGLVRPFDQIAPLSLPVTLGTKLKTTKGKFLRDFWREPLAQEMEESLKRCPMPVIVYCGAAHEDEAVLTPDLLPEGTRVTRVEFKIPGRESAAESMGEFVRWALQSRCMTFEELLEFRGLEDDGPDSYRLSPKNKSEDLIVFEEAVADGGDAGWRRQLAESGKGKKAFMKEAAGTRKTRHLRTEISKAFKKDPRRQKRKRSAIY